MKNLRLFIFTILMLNVAFASEIPDFKLRDLNNRLTSFSEVTGEQITLVDFWATWCKPCLRAIPKLVKIQEAYKDRGVNIVGVNVDSPRNTAKVKPLSRSLGINYPVLLDTNSEVMADLHVNLLPTLLFVDKDNKIVHTHQGFRPGDEKEIIKIIEELLNDTDK